MFDRSVLRDKKFIPWAALLFLVGFAIGLPIDGKVLFNRIAAESLPQEWREGASGLINPLLGVNYPDKAIFDDLKPLTDRLNSVIQQAKSNNQATRISVYFKDQATSHWTGINETDTFAPASLIKIPMMITYFKVAESDPAILSKQIQYVGPDQNTIETFKPSKQMVIGQYYTVDDLIQRMIIYSDNNAIAMLFDNMDKKTLDQVFAELSITLPKDVKQTGDYITPGNFSRFFRTLYNATYLDEEYSQKALGLLARTDFKNGLAAGVPSDVTVAHKFGETPDVDQNGSVVGYELHDCGIVYVPSHPYVLCVMTTGPSYSALSGVIKNISSTVYSTVTNGYK